MKPFQRKKNKKLVIHFANFCLFKYGTQIMCHKENIFLSIRIELFLLRTLTFYSSFSPKLR